MMRARTARLDNSCCDIADSVAVECCGAIRATSDSYGQDGACVTASGERAQQLVGVPACASAQDRDVHVKR